MLCSITWNGEVYPVECPDPATAAIVMETFLGTHPGLRQPGLALFALGGLEVPPYCPVENGADLVLRPRVVY